MEDVVDVADANSAVVLGRDWLPGRCAYYQGPFAVPLVGALAVAALALEHEDRLEGSTHGHH